MAALKQSRDDTCVTKNTDHEDLGQEIFHNLFGF